MDPFCYITGFLIHIKYHVLAKAKTEMVLANINHEHDYKAVNLQAVVGYRKLSLVMKNEFTSPHHGCQRGAILNSCTE